MSFRESEFSLQGVRLSYLEDEEEVGYVYLYFLRNDAHSQLFCFGEDLRVAPQHRRQGIASKLAAESVRVARERGCYKFLGFSRFGRDDQHKRMESYGFEKWGYEFRMDLDGD